ncbi:MAG: translocation/assembly module TamB domain-containing protein [Bernardetiaceae bacterium]
MKAIKYHSLRVIRRWLRQRSWWRFWGGFLGRSVMGLLVLMGLLSSESVQTFLAQQATSYLGPRLGFVIEIGRLGLDFRGNIRLQEVYVGRAEGKGMLDAQDLRLTFDWEALIQRGDLRIEYIQLKNACFDMIFEPDSSDYNINLFIRAIERLASSSPDPSDTSAAPFEIGNFYLENVNFSLQDPTIAALDSGEFDPAHFELTHITGAARNFYASRDTIQLEAEGLQFQESKSDIFVAELTTFFRICRKGMDFERLRLQIGESILRHTLRLRYNGYADMKNFTQKVRLEAALQESFLTTDDLAKFLPALKSYQDAFWITADARGRIESLSLDIHSLKFGTESHLTGTAYLRGLPKIDETFLKIHLESSIVHTRDLKTWLGLKESQNFFQLGKMQLNANFVGMIGDFIADGVFDTRYGRIISDINLKLHQQQSYSGKLTLQAFDLGRWLNIPDMGKISLRGTINGRGLNQKAANFQLDGVVDSVIFNAYTYKDIRLDGYFLKEAFQGKINSEDPNLTLALEGKLDLSDSSFFLTADTLSIDFQALRFSQTPLRLYTQFQADFIGLDPDKTLGDVHFDTLYLAYNDQTDLTLDGLYLEACTDQNQQRTIAVHSAALYSSLYGNFTFARLLTDLNRYQRNYRAYLIGDTLRQETPADFMPYSIDYELHIADSEPFARAFLNKLSLRDTLRIRGRTQIWPDSVAAQLDLSLGKITYQNQQLSGIKVDASLHKSPNNAAFISHLALHSTRQHIAGLDLERMELLADLQKKHLLFSHTLRQQDSKDSLHWQGKIAIENIDDTTALRLTIAPPQLNLLGQGWTGKDTTRIWWQGPEIILEDTFLLGYQDAFVSLAGRVSEDSTARLQFKLASIDLQMFSAYTGYHLEGMAQLDAQIGEIYGNLHLDGTAAISQLHLNGHDFGDIHLASAWEDANNAIKLEIDYLQNRRNVLRLSGYYLPMADHQESLNLDAEFVGVRLKPLEVFAEGLISDLDGRTYGAVKVRGTPQKPKLSGSLFVTGGGLRVDYLNTRYRFSDKIDIEEDHFILDRFKLIDTNGRRAFLDGGVYHSDFKNFLVRMRGDMSDFLMLNTNAQSPEPYYGQAVGTGNLSIDGDLDNLQVEVNATVGRQTRLYLPLDGYEGVTVRDYIRFVPPPDTTTEASTEDTRPTNTTHFSLLLNLEITEKAYAEVIFDRRAGDLIRGSGRGKIAFNYSSRGDFSMFGDVMIVDGSYNFTFLNVVNKRFDVKPGSRIAWSGDPYKAQLDLTAVYEQYASLAPILSLQDSSVRNNSALQRKYPVRVNLGMRGDLYKPDLSFGIDFPEYPPVVVVNGLPLSMQGQVAAFETRIQNDAQELNRQVFSLIVLRRLAESNTFEGVNQSAGSSVGELLSNQLSYWVSQVDDRLEVDLDMNGLNRDALTGAQLRLSYSMLDGRVRIMREGGFTNVQNQADLSSIAGDWTLEYIITEDGRFRAKVYHRNNLSSFGAALGNTSTAGASLLATYSFDRLQEIFRLPRSKSPNLVRDNEILLE